MSNLDTAEQVAARLQVKAETVRRWARAGVIPSLKLSDKVVRFDVVAVEEALRSRAAERKVGA